MDISVNLPKRELPNIVLIILDTLRADHIPMYGYKKPTSPFLEELADKGAVYLNTISPAAWTLPAHASLFTGTYPSTHQTHRSSRYLPAELMTLAEVLSAAGYRCCGVTNNAWVSSLTGLDRGFHSFSLGGRIVRPAEMGGEFVDSGVGSRAAYIINKTYRQFFKWRYDDGAPWINRLAMKWVEEQRGDAPFFLFINYKETHLPYTPPREYRNLFLEAGWSQERIRQVNQDPHRYVAGKIEMSEEDFAVLKALYDAEIRYVDSRVKELFEFLKKRGHLENSLFVVAADHGDNIGDHGLMGHQHCVYDSLARVPLVAFRPQMFNPGAVVERHVQLTDFFPTVLEATGIQGDPWEQNQGIPLNVDQRREFTVIEYLAPAHDILERRFPGMDASRFKLTFRALRTEQYKVIQASNDNVELYDLVKDPGELNNIAANHPEIVTELLNQLSKWVSAHPPKRTQADNRKFDRDVEDRLRDLGYL